MSSFSKHYRYITVKSRETESSVKEEIDFLDDYLVLMGYRFEGKFVCSIDERLRECSGAIPVLALQILVENVFKHNSMSATNPIHIDVEMPDDDHILVRNDYRPIIQPERSTGTGLMDISEQYRLAGSKISVEKTERYFTVTIPILKQEEI